MNLFKMNQHKASRDRYTLYYNDENVQVENLMIKPVKTKNFLGRLSVLSAYGGATRSRSRGIMQSLQNR